MFKVFLRSIPICSEPLSDWIVTEQLYATEGRNPYVNNIQYTYYIYNMHICSARIKSLDQRLEN